MDYYNEIDEFACGVLQAAMDEGMIARGIIDRRSIEDVTVNDLRGFTQCHFFAGIGIWPYALRKAGWPATRPVWTGSCPCQPFSEAGQSGGFDDERHLWPAWKWLIRGSRPSALFGEQVTGYDGRAWIDLVSDDLDGDNYAFGPLDICSAGFGSPNLRNRNYFVAVANRDGERLERRVLLPQRRSEQSAWQSGLAGGDGFARAVNGFWREADWIKCDDGSWRPVEPGTFPLASRHPARVGLIRSYGNALNAEVATHFIRAFLEHEIVEFG